ncbi:MAG: tRNA pseudouridine(55) synthase TruB [Thermoguttaceae bacterium]|nr:tRNA pseudouridine(55) synthase TruB [Thermoguttaceae bacterium]MDW8037324.1 tRNA pseudouridine(55) synthase TruB [Thermoguttaceae bacterium]
MSADRFGDNSPASRGGGPSGRQVAGILNIYKPSGLTSRDVVNQIQCLVRPLKVGHAGTLDPLATGVLVVCVGPATRLIQYIQRMPKEYVGTFLLGRCSPTEDTDGPVTELAGCPVPSQEEVETAARRMLGPILQRPPAYSALKVEGRRAYELARQGQQVDLKPRPVTIYRLDVISYNYPELVLRIRCSSGTYARAVGRDLAAALGTSAVMSALERTAVGPFRSKYALRPEQLTPDNWDLHLLPCTWAVEGLPTIRLRPAEVLRVRQGQTIFRFLRRSGAKEFAAVDRKGRLVAILVPRGEGRLGPSRTLPPV